MRITLAVAVACLGLGGISVATEAHAAFKQKTSIPAQVLGPALQALAKERDLQLVYATDEVGSLRTSGAVGELTTDQALTNLLRGTGLIYRYLDDNTITVYPRILPKSADSSSPSPRESTTGQERGAEANSSFAEGRTSGDSSSDTNLNQQVTKAFWDRFRLAQADVTSRYSSSFGGADSSHDNDSNQEPKLEEIIVTATKRPEAVRQISGSITALTDAELEAVGASSFEDYIERVPGVVFNASVPGFSTVAIRGVSGTTMIAPGQEATGYFINDVPLTDPYSAVAIPDIDTFDVDNVSVLRGPQGTLFGSASLGGSINYQAAPPNLSAYQAHVQVTGEGVDAGGAGYSTKMMVNIPVIEGVFAIRGVYVYRQDPGFIDNVGTHTKNSNTTLVRGGRIEAEWRPTASTRISYLFLDQTEDNPDWGYSEPGSVGAFQKNSAIPEPFNFSTRINNLRLDQDLGFATFTATAAYHQKAQFSDTDETSFVQSILPGATGVAGSPENVRSDGSTIEARLASPTGTKLEYLVGAMHDDTRIKLAGVNPVSNAAQLIDKDFDSVYGPNIGEQIAADGSIFDSALNFDGQETAIFGEATYHLDNQWKVTLGGRQFWTQSSITNSQSGFLQLLFSGSDSLVQSGRQNESGFTPKASITWSPNDTVMTYALVSEGFRFGGPNTVIPEPGVTIPSSFRSDSLINYEIGTRTNWFDGSLQVDVTPFYIDWSNIQVQLPTPNGVSTYGANAGEAHNYGVESTATWRATRALTLQTNVTYLSATLAEDSPVGASGAIIPKGSVLPGASKWSVASTASYKWESAPLTPTVLVSQRYRSTAPSAFANSIPLGGFDVADARLTLHPTGQFQVTGFINNILDSRGVTGGSNFGFIREFPLRPRTVGITLDYKM